MSTLDNVVVEDEDTTASFFSMIPHLICRICLGGFEIGYYTLLKSIAGDKGQCFMSQQNIADQMRCSTKTIQRLNKYLSQPFEALNGKPIIRIRESKNAQGGRGPNIITLVNIFPENYDLCTKKLNIKAGPRVIKKPSTVKTKKSLVSERESRGDKTSSLKGADSKSHKEERYKEDLSSKNDIDRKKEAPESLAPKGDRLTPKGDRSLDIRRKIALFDPHTYHLQADKYRFPDQEPLSRRFIHALKKYSQEDLQKFKANLLLLEEKIQKNPNFSPDKGYEAYLQRLITINAAAKDDCKWHNSLIAEIEKAKVNCKNMKILKTCVQFFDDKGRKVETISMELPSATFKETILHYINK